jgi:lysophosphatidylglycerol acyltransferase 1
VQDNSGKIKWVIDMTIAYPNGEAPNLLFLAFSMGKVPPIHIYYKVFDINNVPKDEKGFTKWMYDRYVEKDTMLGRFYSIGTLTENAEERVEYDVAAVIIYVLFYTVWMWWFCMYVYPPVFLFIGWKLIFLVVVCYICYFIYDFVMHFQFTIPTTKE